MKMDFAMFVVHAHESVLLINNDNLEHGYAKVYRALLQATGGNVIVVVGGDDNYKNETEEEQCVISRWAETKIANSQFSKEFMDGRKSFVFSWNKKHREIHEEALLHYFDPSKKGQKFEYQRPQEASAQTRQSNTATQPYNPPAVNVSGEPVLLRSLVRYGRISYQVEDLQLWEPTFTLPDCIDKILIQRYHDTPVTGVTIVQCIDGTLRWSVNPKLIEVSRSRYEGIEIADNETLMLKTRICYGKVSFQESDVHFRHGTWQIPQYIVESLKEKYRATPSGDLYIISDDREQLRVVVKIGAVNRARSALNKMGL